MGWLKQTITDLFRRTQAARGKQAEKLSCQDFADILADHVSRAVLENRDGPPSPELRKFAQSVDPTAAKDTIDAEILFLLSFLLSQVCVIRIGDRANLDDLVPSFYKALASRVRSEVKGSGHNIGG